MTSPQNTPKNQPPTRFNPTVAPDRRNWDNVPCLASTRPWHSVWSRSNCRSLPLTSEWSTNVYVPYRIWSTALLVGKPLGKPWKNEVGKYGKIQFQPFGVTSHGPSRPIWFEHAIQANNIYWKETKETTFFHPFSMFFPLMFALRSSNFCA